MALFKRQQANKISVLAPIDGLVIPLEQIPDPVFAQKMMGDGIAIEAKGDIVYAPIDGVITLIAETKHAFGLTGSNGVELMVHVGLDTVQFQGEGFEVLANVGAQITQGTPILKLDHEFFAAKHANLITPIIILNHEKYPIKNMTTNLCVSSGKDQLYEIES